MIVTRLKIPLEQAEYSALLKVALSEMRNPSDQARYILRQDLERRGLLILGEPIGRNQQEQNEDQHATE